MRCLKQLFSFQDRLDNMPNLTKLTSYLLSIILVSSTDPSFAQVNFGWDYQFFQCTDTVFYSDSTIAPQGKQINSWKWNFGDGSFPSYLQNPTHAYNSAGIYAVQLNVTYTDSSQDSIVKSIVIPGAIPEFSILQQDGKQRDSFLICIGDEITILNHSSGDLIDPQYEMIWGDGVITNPNSNGDPANHVYSTIGSFKLYMVLSAEIEGTLIRCNTIFPDTSSDLITKKEFIVHVLDRPKADFNIGTDPTFIGHPTAFETDLDSIYTRMVWDFGDGSLDTFTDVKTSIIHKYYDQGTYTVTLVPEYTPSIPDAPVCPDTIRKQVMVLHDSLNSMEELEEKVMIIPNPTSSGVLLNLDRVYNTVQLELFDSEAKSINTVFYQNVSKIYLDSDLRPGQYFVKITLDQNEVVHKKIIKL